MAENRTFQLQRDHFQTSEYKENTLKSLFLCCLLWLLFDLGNPILIFIWSLYNKNNKNDKSTASQNTLSEYTPQFSIS